MTIELLLLGDAPVAAMAERAKLAERNGFDTVWLADERFYREVYTSLAVVAEHTSRVQLGPCVTDPFARHPALTAVAIATLDEISNGRAILGLGGGISGFAELGIEPRKPPRAIRETIELVRALMTGEQVDYQGEIIQFRDGHLGFKPERARVPIAIASNGPLGQRAAGALADAAIMEACGNVEEAQAFRDEVGRGAEKAGRTLRDVKLTARLNCCISNDGRAARDAVRPSVARMLGRGSMRFATIERQGLAFSEEVRASVANAPYGQGAKPYLPLLPLATDRHVDALTLAGTVAEVTARVAELRRAGIDSFIIRPIAAPGASVDETIVRFGTEVRSALEGARTVSFSLHRPSSAEDAVDLARRLGPGARFIAGGTDLVIQINRRQQAPDHVIDLSRLGDLDGIEEMPDRVVVGALTTHKTIERHPAFAGALAALREAACVVGGHQVRNIATIGGNIANASPAADLLPPLLAFDADIALLGPGGSRRMPLGAFLLGPRRTAREPDEVLRSVSLARPADGSASAFLKFGRRKAMEISVVSVAARLTIDPDSGRCRDVRIAVGAVAPTAIRAVAAEEALEGEPAGEAAFREAGRLAAAAASPITDVRASSDYRRILIETLVPRALARCRQRIAEAAR